MVASAAWVPCGCVTVHLLRVHIHMPLACERVRFGLLHETRVANRADAQAAEQVAALKACVAVLKSEKMDLQSEIRDLTFKMTCHQDENRSLSKELQVREDALNEIVAKRRGSLCTDLYVSTVVKAKAQQLLEHEATYQAETARTRSDVERLKAELASKNQCAVFLIISADYTGVRAQFR